MRTLRIWTSARRWIICIVEMGSADSTKRKSKDAEAVEMRIQITIRVTDAKRWEYIKKEQRLSTLLFHVFTD